MADEIPNGTDVILSLLGERQCRAYQVSNTLTSRIVASLDVIDEPGFLWDRFVVTRWNHACIDHILIRIKRCLLLIHRWKSRPQWLRTFATAVAAVNGNNLTGGSVEGQSQPWLVHFFLYKTVFLNR
jgi:hypothetical protein